MQYLFFIDGYQHKFSIFNQNSVIQKYFQANKYLINKYLIACIEKLD